MSALEGPDWGRDGADWPNRDASRFVEAGGMSWHVQIAGQGPVVLLLHGTGAATHSWRGLLPLLARRFTVVAPDLPGHGFSDWPPRDADLSLRGMARGVAGLLDALGLRPDLAVGHSAGAAVAARMALDGSIRPRAVIAINGALLPMRGLSWQLFSPVAKLLACNALAPRMFARSAEDRRAVERLLRGTGSRLDAAGVDFYARVVRRPRHAAAALGMMARWDLDGLARALPKLACDLVLIVGGDDRSIPPSESGRVARLRQSGAGAGRTRMATLPGLGHLAHEEDPGAVADLVVQAADEAGILT